VELPRVLIVSPTRIGSQTATGVVMANFFRRWPTGSIGQIHSDQYSDIEHDVCQHYYYVKSHRKQKRLTRMFGESFADVLDFRWLQWTGETLKAALAWSKRFRPHVIYYRGVDKPYLYRWLPLKLAWSMDIPLVTHIMDDWPARSESTKDKGIKKHLVPALENHLQELFSASAVNLSICSRMSEAFEARYGMLFIPFHNGIDVDVWSAPRKKMGARGDRRFRMVYTGSLALDMQIFSLKDIAEVVSDLRKRDINIGLEIYGAKWWLPNYKKYFHGIDGVRYGGFVPRSEFPRLLMAADLLVLPVNFDEKSLRYVRYSLANKAPEYMASGTPVLVYGPREAATVEYAASEGWGHVVSQCSKEKLQAAILDLMSSPDKRVEMGQKARALAFSRHDAAKVRTQFRTLLTQVARGERPKA